MITFKHQVSNVNMALKETIFADRTSFRNTTNRTEVPATKICAVIPTEIIVLHNTPEGHSAHLFSILVSSFCI